MPRQHVENTKEFCSENEAKRANKHANRRIIYWPPFWNKVYEFIPFFDFQYEKIIFNCPIDPPTFQLSLRSLRSKHRNADRMDQKVSFFLDCDYDVYELV